MKRLAFAFVLLLTLGGCTATDVIGMFTPGKPSVEVNANVGKNVEQDKSVVKVESGNTTNKQEAESISNDTQYQAQTIQQITNQLPPWMFALVILLAGWAIPTPKECFAMLKGVICSVFTGAGGIVKTTFKSGANFILLLFGKERL